LLFRATCTSDHWPKLHTRQSHPTVHSTHTKNAEELYSIAKQKSTYTTCLGLKSKQKGDKPGSNQQQQQQQALLLLLLDSN
jgi:membrane-anchored protein YejM (alkaline phosphatase superfamily)